MINTIDPLGGSYFVEEMTQRMVDGAFDYFRRIDELGGMVEAIEVGFPQREIVEAAYAAQRAIDSGQKLIVGVNAFQEGGDGDDIELLYVSDEVATAQIERLNAVRASRDGAAATRALDALKRGAEGTANTMPLLIDCVKAYCTVGEISDALREVFGTYVEPRSSSEPSARPRR